jgi:Raf kinase inhibitor-like YbhB/YbcL family protein
LGWSGRVTGGLARRAAALLAAVPLLAACGLLGGPQQLRQDAPEVMTVTSPAFGQGIIPGEYTCHGRGRPPPIYWSGAPQGTKSLALVVDDADAPITPYIYWIVLDISPATTDIQAGLLPPGARQADNSRGFPGYDAPCPIHGSHKYRFTIYALSSAYVMRSALRLGNGASAKAAWTAIARSAIARGRLTATANGLPNR